MTAKVASDRMSVMPNKRKPKNVEVGKRLELLRRAHGYETMQAMADQLGIPHDTWRAWEKGDNEFPVEMARTLRNRWGVTLDYIYEGSETALPQPVIAKLRKAA